MSSHSGLFFLPVTSSWHGTVGPSAGLTGTTQDAPGAEQTDCHHAVMDLTFSQTLGGRLLLFQAEFSGSNPPIKCDKKSHSTVAHSCSSPM